MEDWPGEFVELAHSTARHLARFAALKKRKGGNSEFRCSTLRAPTKAYFARFLNRTMCTVNYFFCKSTRRTARKAELRQKSRMKLGGVMICDSQTLLPTASPRPTTSMCIVPT
jgi:hypothetical protein